ncbi:MAG: DMT family transporter [Trueperaceae bacterium]|nr:DMT family transporter [Trueperaceae bacterium]
MPSSAPSAGRLALVLSAAVLAISMAAIFTRLADAPGGVVALWRMVIATLLIAPAGLRGLRRAPPSAAALRPALFAGVLLGVHFATWLSSLAYTTVAASVTLVTTVPIWVALLAWIGGTRPTRGVLIGLALALTGGAAIGFGDLHGGSAPLLGDALALLGAWSVSGYFLLGRRAQRAGLSTSAYAGVAYATAAVVLLPLPALLGVPYVAWPAETWLWIAAMALAPQLIGHGGLNWANRHLDPTLVATVTLLEPIGAGLLALLLFAEVPGPGVLAGAPVLLIGVALVVRYRRRGEPVAARSGAPRRPDVRRDLLE